MTTRLLFSIAAGALAGAALIAAPAAAQCWSGGTAGQGVPRESLLVTNRAPFAVNVMAGPAGGAQRVLGQVPAGTTMSFASVLPPGRNQTTLWVSPEDQDKYKLPTARQTGAINIVNRRDLTCRRAAQLDVTQAVFAGVPRQPNTNVARRTDLSKMAPAAGPRRAAVKTTRKAAAPAAKTIQKAATTVAKTTPKKTVVKTTQNATVYKRANLTRLAPGAGPRTTATDPALQGRQPGEPTGSAGVVRY